jgi:hypothetical protein
MKKIIVIAALGLMSFTTQEEKKVTLTFTVEEVNLIYAALGELPAKTTEQLRYKIALEAQKQLNPQEPIKLETKQK